MLPSLSICIPSDIAQEELVSREHYALKDKHWKGFVYQAEGVLESHPGGPQQLSIANSPVGFQRSFWKIAALLYPDQMPILSQDRACSPRQSIFFARAMLSSRNNANLKQLVCNGSSLPHAWSLSSL
jgi:hypothetical protein